MRFDLDPINETFRVLKWAVSILRDGRHYHRNGNLSYGYQRGRTGRLQPTTWNEDPECNREIVHKQSFSARSSKAMVCFVLVSRLLAARILNPGQELLM